MPGFCTEGHVYVESFHLMDHSLLQTLQQYVNSKFFFYFLLGQVSVQRAMCMVNQYKSKYRDSVDGYIEEGVIRRELSDNFCYYNEYYDDIKGE